MSYRGLIFIGLGGIIGGGFFLGSGLPIRMAGPAVLLAFLIGGLVMAQVIGALTSITQYHPVHGSFAVYSNTYLGRFAGFLQGWTYYLTGVLTMIVIILMTLYIGSIGLMLFIQPWQQVNTATSPFVSALNKTGILWFGTIFNGVILVAAFSVMAGALYSANQILFSLGHTGEAPKFVTRVTKHGFEVGAFAVTAVCIALILGISLILPANVYNFLVSASSFFTFFNWFVILWTFLVWRKRALDSEKFTSILAFGQPASTVITMLVLLVLAGFALLQPDQRMGFYASLGICLAVTACYFLFGRRKAQVH
jgi:L-asparagine transporter-like permease